MIRYYLGTPVIVASALEGWVLGFWPDGREFTFWHKQLRETAWGLDTNVSRKAPTEHPKTKKGQDSVCDSEDNESR